MATQSFLVSDDQGNGVQDAFVYVEWFGGWDSGYTDENGVVNLEVSPTLALTAYALKDGYVCYDFYCDRCEYGTTCYRDNFYYMPDASMTLGLKPALTPTPTATPTPSSSGLNITETYYSLDDGTTWTQIFEDSTIYLTEGTTPRFKVKVRNEGAGASYIRSVWLREGYDCAAAGLIGATASETELDYWDTEELEFDITAGMKSDQGYSFHVKDGQYIPGCPSDDEFDFYNISLYTPTPTPTPTPTSTAIPTATPTATPSPTTTPTATSTPTATPTPTPEFDIKAYLDCIFPRLLTGDFTPRISCGDPIPRITCLNEVGIPKII